MLEIKRAAGATHAALRGLSRASHLEGCYQDVRTLFAMAPAKPHPRIDLGQRIIERRLTSAQIASCKELTKSPIDHLCLSPELAPAFPSAGVSRYDALSTVSLQLFALAIKGEGSSR